MTLVKETVVGLHIAHLWLPESRAVPGVYSGPVKSCWMNEWIILSIITTRLFIYCFTWVRLFIQLLSVLVVKQWCWQSNEDQKGYRGTAFIPFTQAFQILKCSHWSAIATPFWSFTLAFLVSEKLKQQKLGNPNAKEETLDEGNVALCELHAQFVLLAIFL